LLIHALLPDTAPITPLNSKSDRIQPKAIVHFEEHYTDYYRRGDCCHQRLHRDEKRSLLEWSDRFYLKKAQK
ncbi:MAG: hypothetical protein F6K35_36945, partial [Okeania sp. SIO2H7]|nr:hypothetical protein [Okeania sp. SIO2H7]